ncbi:hypothetical protein [Microbacterium sp.]|uniref:hypothetical protein n=1 Tax=Microbacterium sp. TaxID=51671 RepID=UPI0039E3F515
MSIARACISLATIALCASLVACSGAEQPQSGAEPTTSSSAAPTSQPTADAGATAEPGTDAGTTPDQPVAKVARPGDSGTPSVSAKPADTSGPVTYDDKVTLRIDEVSFAKETSQGPGSFTDREYTRLTITFDNGSSAPIDLGSSVLTMLDAGGAPVAPVYAVEANVSDFSGTVAAGASTTAAYAFALPASSRDQVTLVIDFDGAHTSAVFRGGLS